MCQSINVIAIAGMIIRFFDLHSLNNEQCCSQLLYGQAPYASQVAAYWQCLPSGVAFLICESASCIQHSRLFVHRPYMLIDAITLVHSNILYTERRAESRPTKKMPHVACNSPLMLLVFIADLIPNIRKWSIVIHPATTKTRT